jgi:hypothetical protein
MEGGTVTRAAPEGALVCLHLDLESTVVRGDVIETQTGRRYAVATVRVQERGKHRGRQHVVAHVLGQVEIDPGTTVQRSPSPCRASSGRRPDVRKRIMIRLRDAAQFVDADVVGPWAVHRTLGWWWHDVGDVTYSVTFVPNGGSLDLLAAFEQRAEAIALARTLQARVPAAVMKVLRGITNEQLRTARRIDDLGQNFVDAACVVEAIVAEAVAS